MIVTIDGPAGTGKSSAARGLAARLGFEFLDTGAMYRAVALRCVELRVPANDSQRAAEIANKIQIEFEGSRVWIDRRDVTEYLRGQDVAQSASIVAGIPEVRAALVEQQRRLAAGRNMVCEGRDQGTVVFPQAECKFFLEANPEVRARRRQAELDTPVSLEALIKQQHERDERDRTRAVGPLIRAIDAISVDTTDLSLEDVLNLLESQVRSKCGIANAQ